MYQDWSMVGEYIFTKLVWKDHPPKPYLRYSQKNSIEYQDHPINYEETLDIKVVDGYYCIGTDYNRGQWLTCSANQTRIRLGTIIANNPHLHMDLPGPIPDQIRFLQKRGIDLPHFKERIVGERSLQCGLCQSSEYFTCRMYCRGEVCDPTSPSAKKLCEPPNTSVYLTYVGNEFKIGVSLGLPRRWVEQGSDLAVEIARGPGLEARRIEQIAADTLGLKLQVRNETKLRNLGQIDRTEGKKELERLIRKIRPIVTNVFQENQGRLIKNPVIHNFKAIYGRSAFDSPVQVVDISDGIEFGGTLVAAKGSIIIVQQDNYYFAMDTKQLRSMRFDFLDQQASVKKQSYLDDWF